MRIMKQFNSKNKKHVPAVTDEKILRKMKELNVGEKCSLRHETNRVLTTKKNENSWISVYKKIPSSRHHTSDTGKHEKKDEYNPHALETKCLSTPVIKAMEIFQEDFSIFKDSDITKEEAQVEKNQIDSQNLGDKSMNEKKLNNSQTLAESGTSTFLNYNLCQSKSFTILENISFSLNDEKPKSITSTTNVNILPTITEGTEQQSCQSLDRKDSDTNDFLFSHLSKACLNNVSVYHNFVSSPFANCKAMDNKNISEFSCKKSNINFRDFSVYSRDISEFENRNEAAKNYVYAFKVNANCLNSPRDGFKNLNCVMKFIRLNRNFQEDQMAKRRISEEGKKISPSYQDFKFIPKHSEIETFKHAIPRKRGNLHLFGARCYLRQEVPQVHQRNKS